MLTKYKKNILKLQYLYTAVLKIVQGTQTFLQVSLQICQGKWGIAIFLYEQLVLLYASIGRAKMNFRNEKKYIMKIT